MKALSGGLETDAVLEGAVLVEGDLVVPAGIALTLRPGTTVAFAPRPRWSCAVFRSAAEGYPIEATEREACDLVVMGRLVVEGSREAPVLLGAGGVPWGGISILGRGRGRLAWTRLAGAGAAAVQAFDSSRLHLEECGLEGAEFGVWAWGTARVTLRGGSIAAGRCGLLCCEGSQALAEGVELRAPQACSATDFSLVRLSGCRVRGASEQAVSARRRSWARLEGCRLDPGCATIRREEARLDA